ncbi:MAG: DUF3810 family protein [Oscillospiraceae bacterium]|nr:DUF3810 family protein [Oscillospiraceae bacterium]
MKYLRGYLTAAIFAVLTVALRGFARSHSALVDMIYPYVTRMAQNYLADWSSGVSVCLWQVLLIWMLMLILATLVLLLIFKWNPIRWFGWVCAVVAVIVFLNFGVFGLNDFSGPLSEDIRLTETGWAIDELEDAAAYYRDQANALSDQVPRDHKGNVVFDDFDTLAAQASEGFEKLVYEQSLSVFAGSFQPVKKLGWASRYTAQGITGVTVPITGEAAVNPQSPTVVLPYAMCQQMARRAGITIDQDASLAAYLACRENSSVQFQYSGMLMSYRACLNAVAELEAVLSSGAYQRVTALESENLKLDMAACDNFFGTRKMDDASVCDLLTSWHIQQIVLPSIVVEQDQFDPMDKTQVDVTN